MPDITITSPSSDFIGFLYDKKKDIIRYQPINKKANEFNSNYSFQELIKKIKPYIEAGISLLHISLKNKSYIVQMLSLDEDNHHLYTINISEQNEIFTTFDSGNNLNFSDVHKIKLITLGEMTSGIIHDIKNPVSMSLSSIELLKFKIEELEEFLDKDNEEISDLIDDIKNKLSFLEDGNSRVNDVIEGIGLLSRKEQAEFSIFNLNDFFKKNISFLKYELDKKGVSLDVKLKEKIELKGKESLLSQVIVNIIKNAIDAVENQPFNKKWIEIDAKEDPNFVTIFIKDSGPGVPDNIKNKILEPYFTTKAVGKGTGLGLSLSNQILNLHKGSISIENSSESVFILKISKDL